ncbi:MAG: hypothetical protein KME05_15660 [Gloeocapsa sp. UFS-A4-WI-NPMV-4B04]|jgi:hypothetical protein|nr:hypothetical protein [Gloeocapsa sp. UFS-A4-WI-NPMV-4B04]
MSNSQMRDVSEAVLSSMTEEEFVNYSRHKGNHVVHHRGRYWEEMFPGLYQPVHFLARLSADQVTRPSLLCWGFRAALSEDDQEAANGSIPVHLLSNVEGYTLETLASKRRNQLRKCCKLVKIVQLIGSALLQEQGYGVLVSSLQRTLNPTGNPYRKMPLKEDYLADLADWSTHKNELILAGFIGDKLGGYIIGYAVDGTAYMESVDVATEALATNISTGLYFEFVQACRRSGKICEIVNSPHMPEDPALGNFKEGMGFPVKYVPSKVQLNPIIEKYSRYRRPLGYYRLTGYIDHNKS